jgi:hypothetical protein
LTKAISIHGNASAPPIKGRQSPAFKALEEWVKQTLEDNVQLQTAGPVVNLAHDAPDKRAEAVPPDGKLKPSQTGGSVQSPPGDAHAGPADRSNTVSSGFGANQTAKGAASAPSTTPLDPFDPAIFNQANKPPR